MTFSTLWAYIGSTDGEIWAFLFHIPLLTLSLHWPYIGLSGFQRVLREEEYDFGKILKFYLPFFVSDTLQIINIP
jgi:hypothetical protein